MSAAAGRRVGGLLLAAWLAAGHASADPVVIVQGGFTYEGDPFGYSFLGDGVIIQGGGSGIAISSPVDRCPFPCAPGATLNLGSTLGGGLTPGNLAVGNATIRGSTFTSAFGYILLGGTLSFTGPDVVLPQPPAGADTWVTLTSLFSFRGHVAGFDVTDSAWTPGALLFESQLTGSGAVTLVAFYDGETGRYLPRSVTYDFAAVPEPATVLLVVLGCAGIARQRLLDGRLR